MRRLANSALSKLSRAEFILLKSGKAKIKSKASREALRRKFIGIVVNIGPPEKNFGHPGKMIFFRGFLCYFIFKSLSGS